MHASATVYVDHSVLFTATDKSGACEMTYSEFLVDITPPEVGELKTGPWYDMVSRVSLITI